MCPTARFVLPLLTLGITASACVGPSVMIQEDPAPRSLSEALEIATPEVVGITVEPETGRRFLLDRNEGIFELDEEGTATLFLALDEFPTPEVTPRSAFTDFVALGNEVFAITARSDGFRLDVQADTLTQYFCYVPGEDWEEPIVDQLTDSLAFDAQAELIYAQPQSFALDDLETPIASGLGAYTLQGGQPVVWYEMPDVSLLAGGATVLADGSILLVDGNELFRFRIESEEGLVGKERLKSLTTLEQVEQVDGLAFDPQRGSVLVVDSSQDLLLEIRVVILND